MDWICACGKVSYPTGQAAYRSYERQQRRHRRPQRVYRCGHGGIHLASKQDHRRRKTRRALNLPVRRRDRRQVREQEGDEAA